MSIVVKVAVGDIPRRGPSESCGCFARGSESLLRSEREAGVPRRLGGTIKKPACCVTSAIDRLRYRVPPRGCAKIFARAWQIDVDLVTRAEFFSPFIW